MAVINDLRRLLKSNFPGATIHLSRRPGERIVGQIVWKGFSHQDHLDRQIKLQKVMEDGLPADQLAKISHIMALSPDENIALSVS